MNTFAFPEYSPWACRLSRGAAVVWLWLAAMGVAGAQGLEIVVSGVEAAPAKNVRAQVADQWNSALVTSGPRRRARFEQELREQAASALRPFGFYRAVVNLQLQELEDQQWRLSLAIQPGEPVLVESARISVTGPGASMPALQAWQSSWPLQAGQRLDQTVWEERKQSALDSAALLGFLLAQFSRHEIELNVETNRARLQLELETGPRAVMGSVEFIQDAVAPGVLRSIPRFEPGEPYRALLVDRLRTDLWRTGYFEKIDVVEIARLDQDPPSVDLRATLTPRKPNTHEFTLGYGTDTEFRGQYRWQRHLLSPRGDSLSAGVGWQQRFDEGSLFGEYRLPRQVRDQQYWLLSSTLRSESQDLALTDDTGEEVVPLGAGRIDSWRTRAGKVRLLNLAVSQEQITETIYVESLLENDDFDRITSRFGSSLPLIFPEDAGFDLDRDLGLGEGKFSLSLGVDYDWPVINGQGFDTQGHRVRTWLFTANEAWGSDTDFTQLYLTGRWNRVFAQRWKVLLRGEVGYTDARVNDVMLSLEGQPFELSVTELPFVYRFRAGGSNSLRGYDFEQLSNNGIGSNNIITASAELEYKVWGNWAGAVFYDVGNAFNDWDQRDLKRGVGLGLRWYTIAGAVRLDFGRALDLEGEPWRVHLSIGSPLL